MPFSLHISMVFLKVNLVLETFNVWKTALDDGCIVDVIYLDYFKAFDTIPHTRSMYKLQVYGICGNLEHWNGSFVTDRTQQVVINGTSSKWHNVNKLMLCYF